MNKKSLSSTIFLVLLFIASNSIFLFTGCSIKERGAVTGVPSVVETVNCQSKSYTVKDDFGNVIELQDKPKRIVSTSISTDEILLGLVEPGRIAALSPLIDDSGISNMVQEGKAVKRRVEKSSPESIVDLYPDLIIFPDFIKPEAIQTFREMHLPVYVYKTPHSIQEVENTIRTFAKLVQEEAKGEILIETMEKRLTGVKNKIRVISDNQKKKVILVRSNSVYYSPDSSFTDLCANAGVRDATADLKYPYAMLVQQETIIQLNPDIFFVIDWNYDGKHDPEQLIKELKGNPSYKDIKAIQNQEVFFLKGTMVQSLSQYMVGAVEEIAAKSYPALFGK